MMPAAMGRGQAQGHPHGQPPHDMFGTVPRGPPMYMTGGDSRQHMSSVPLPPAPPVQSFSVQQQTQPTPQGHPPAASLSPQQHSPAQSSLQGATQPSMSHPGFSLPRQGQGQVPYPHAPQQQFMPQQGLHQQPQSLQQGAHAMHPGHSPQMHTGRVAYHTHVHLTAHIDISSNYQSVYLYMYHSISISLYPPI